jgi:hypothetical protein
LPDSKSGANPIYLGYPAINVINGLKALPIANENPYIIPGRVKDKPLVNLGKPWVRIRARATAYKILGELPIAFPEMTAAL